MLDALMLKNTKDIAEKLVTAAKEGQAWAVTLALKSMLPTRANRVTSPVDREPVTSVEEAAQRVAEIVARMERGEIDLDEGAALIAGLQAFMGVRSVAQLEAEAVEMRQEIAELKAAVETMSGRTR
jgi:hypothetical protein